MSDTNFGASLFALHGGKPNPSDVLDLLGKLAQNPQVRKTALSLGALVGDLPKHERISMCESLAKIFFSRLSPASLPEEPTPTVHIQGTPEFCRIAPIKFSVWGSHVVSAYDKSGHATSSTMSTTVAEILMALEGICGLPGYFVKK